MCGGRGGKSFALIALRLVWGMYRRDLSSLARGQRAKALVVAPNDGLRQEVVDYAKGAIAGSPMLASTLILPRGAKPDDKVQGFSVRRPDGHIVDFLAAVATRGGYGGRGKSLTDFAMDESAFFRDSSANVNDRDIYTAASARVLPGGQSIVASTPWAKAGLLYDFFVRCWGAPQDALVAHAPTEALNDAAWVATIVARERQRDADNARREFDAEFMDGASTLFFDGSSLEAANRNASLVMAPSDLLPGDIVGAGADFGFRSDSSALVIVVRRADRYLVAKVLELRPEPGKPLRPGETVRAFAEELRAWGVRYLMADGHYRESITEHLTEHGLAFVPAPSTPSEPYVRTRNLLREDRIDGLSHHRMLQQMREVEGRPLSGGGLSIVHPRWASGGHGDLCSALVLAVDQVGSAIVHAPTPEHGSREWEEQQRARRRKELSERATGSADRGKRAHWRNVG